MSAGAQKLRVLVGGGSGFVGRALTARLRALGHEAVVLGRGRNADTTWAEVERDGVAGYDAVVNLAGAPLLDVTARWTDAYREECVRSRVDTTRLLARLVREAGERAPRKLVCTSAVGAYPSVADAEGAPVWDEDSALPEPADYPGRLCAQVEAAAAEAAAAARVAVVRPGVVMGPGGGAFANMRLPFLLGLGSPFGFGRHPFPVVSLEDTVGVYVHAVEGGDEVAGTLNAVAPGAAAGPRPLTNLAFSRALAKAMGRPCWPLGPPAALLRAALGDRAQLLVEGQVVAPRRTQALGYTFSHPEAADIAAYLAEGRGR